MPAGFTFNKSYCITRRCFVTSGMLGRCTPERPLMAGFARDMLGAMNLARVIVLALCATSATAIAAPKAAQLAKDRVAVAEKVYTHATAMMKSGRGTVEGVYLWSVRWLGADLDAARPAKQAFADHAARMTELDTEATKAKGAGAVSAGDAEAATYFRIEAELWQARGKR